MKSKSFAAGAGGKTPSDRNADFTPAKLTVDECSEIGRYLQKHFDIHYENDPQHSPLDEDEFGKLATLPAARVFHIAHVLNDWALNREGACGYKESKAYRAIASLVLDAIHHKDHKFFEDMAKMIAIGRRAWPTTPLSKFGVKQDRGRRSNIYDLKRVGPDAVFNCLLRRQIGVDGPPLRYRLTKRELSDAIRGIQASRGLKDPPRVSERSLQGLIKRMGIAKFIDHDGKQLAGESVADYVVRGAKGLSVNRNKTPT